MEKLNVFIMDENDLSFIQSTKKNDVAPVHMMDLEPFTVRDSSLLNNIIIQKPVAEK